MRNACCRDAGDDSPGVRSRVTFRIGAGAVASRHMHAIVMMAAVDDDTDAGDEGRDRMMSDSSIGLDVLSDDECRDLLARSPVGRIAVHLAEHSPAIFPINYAFDEHDIVFRTDASSTLHRACLHTVAFEIDGVDRVYHLGWSVLVVGTLEEVTKRSELAALATLLLGPWAPGPKSRWMRIHPDTITGRSIPTHNSRHREGPRR